MPLSTELQLQMKELELTSLFETIRAINSNASESDLYKIFKFTVSSNPSIGKLALFVYDKVWECKEFYGLEEDYLKVKLPKNILEYTEITEFKSNQKHFTEFHKIIPVKHKTTVLAYVFIGHTDELDVEDKLELDFILALSNIIIVAIENKKLARKEQKQVEYNRQLEIAKNVQSLLLPRKFSANPQVTIEASYLPHHTIGGDYYDFIQINENKMLLCIADVSGKGIPAAILMSNFQAGLRVLCRKSTDLLEIVNELNHLIIQNSQGENFITAFFLLYDSETKSLDYVNAGHNPPFLFHNNQVKNLNEGTTILGSFPELPFIELGKLSDMNDFLVFCFTDGFTETYNEAGEEFGEEYLQNFLTKNIHLPQEDLHPKLIAHLNTFKGKNAYADDITLLSCKVSSK